MAGLSERVGYMLDFAYNTISPFNLHHFPNGLTNPSVWRGYFADDKTGRVQRKLFDILLEEEDFRRTPFQLVFPGQTAGLIKQTFNYKKSDNEERYGADCVNGIDDGIDEAHVRFYRNPDGTGTIDAELEAGRFCAGHYNTRIDGNFFLEEIIKRNERLSDTDKKDLCRQLGKKDYCKLCVRNLEKNPNYGEASALFALWVWEYVIGGALFIVWMDYVCK